MEDIETFAAFISSDYIRGGIAFGVSDVQALAARIGEHIEYVELRPGLVTVNGFESLVVLPKLLPFFLYGVKIIFAFFIVHQLELPVSQLKI